MKIYFTASITGKKYYLKNYERIIKILKDSAHKVLSEHAISGPNHFDSESKKARVRFHQRLKDLIASCDVFIAEVSFPSISVAYEISLALKKNKPSLILYSHQNKEQDLPGILGEIEGDKLLIFKYKLPELPDLLRQSLAFLKEKTDQRFTFFITPKIARYLDEISRKKKIPRAVYIRRLIENDMVSK
ncbi:ribbon-helix-helix domain-containing protein [Candidatus Microgenomates bacterium]|nr:ribbon-helix-helix domain-containing protein [Candidatus Microgenomates bacterium]